jgi:hypothetical protein
MKNTTKFILAPLLFAGILLVGTTCEKEKITYYKTVGVGYVFAYDTMGNLLHPLEGAKISVLTNFEGRRGNFLESEPIEYFFSDATGKYQVRFIKQKQYWGNAGRYDFKIAYHFEGSSGPFEWFTILADEIKNAQNVIKLDTFKVYIEYYQN